MIALIVVDIQNDFLPGGALAVRNGHKIIPSVNKLIKEYDLVVATQDWHPEGHGSFAKTHKKQIGEKINLEGLDQILWPDHCVQGTRGADLAKQLHAHKIHKVFRKGENRRIDSYSGFFDNGHKKDTGLAAYLREKGVTEVHIVGLATDYCVKFTALDAVSLGFKTIVLLLACKGVNLKKNDVRKAIEEMRGKGISVIGDIPNA
jgi:nicotinamidase/pyrazinamidase